MQNNTVERELPAAPKIGNSTK